MVGGAISDECRREAGSSSPLWFQMELPAAGVGASPDISGGACSEWPLDVHRASEAFTPIPPDPVSRLPRSAPALNSPGQLR